MAGMGTFGKEIIGEGLEKLGKTGSKQMSLFDDVADASKKIKNSLGTAPLEGKQGDLFSKKALKRMEKPKKAGTALYEETLSSASEKAGKHTQLSLFDDNPVKEKWSERLGRVTGTGQAGAKEFENLGAATKKVGQNVQADGGWKKMAGHAGAGAMAGGLAGAGINTIRGEDAWEGAKTGATLGALSYGGLNVARASMGRNSIKGLPKAAGEFNQQTGVSKSVRNLHTLAKDSIQSKRANGLK